MLRGEEWKEKRAEITPAFTPNRVSHSLTLNRSLLITVIDKILSTDQSFVPTR
jgi:cytochrome P450